ncbi:pectate lyase [Mixta theicola]|uniref:Pectate lyase n=1 Tax=Mixta theicola TaxID=1458355 RepID=A0A2K1QAQ4_9GAMM|nr:right-handed parallel beta-helix repeat-containing protein [Mixta theicola]PNS12105.1 pectate lyase [Mixta theicola]GLR10724.1 exopolygalacturonate lyase [Mixta theicola]
MKIIPLLLLVTGVGNAWAADALPETESLTWRAITFGQSTDKNFATNVLAEKIGVNQVTFADAQVAAQDGKLHLPATVESRGGKIGNSHDGLTFYYTRLPASANMILEAEVSIDQFGPENGAMPAGQEGAGLLARDVPGKPRLESIRPGYEEFPAAANMAMNAIMTQDKASHHRVQAMLIARNGVTQSWGNTGVEIKRQPYQQNIDLRKTPRFRLRLARTDEGFTAAWAPVGSDSWVTQQTGDADRVTVLDSESYYVGFFAARNARMTVHQAHLTLSPRHAAPGKKFVGKTPPAQAEIASATIAASSEYQFRLRSDRDGALTVSSDGVERVRRLAVKAGEMVSVPLTLKTEITPVSYTLALANGEKISGQLQVTRKKVADINTLYASPQGNAQNDGSRAHPLDVASAAALLAPGGVLWLADGDYPDTTLAAAASGSADRRKHLRPMGDRAVFHGLQLAASYWDIEGIGITKKSFSISGSHNLINRVTAWQANDTGIWIASPSGIGRALWASHNVISHSESWGNKDPGMINADGFAVKMRVGEGNKLVACFSHDNIDDGYDLFNKIEDGPNGVVTIENSVALRNVNNGFKLGGEGIPVAHRISNSVAIENGMDGFTDNFNPGALWVENNIAVDNKRFNFIFRPGPYTQPEKQGDFKNNLSLRSKTGVYADAVTGIIDVSNAFLKSGK